MTWRRRDRVDDRHIIEKKWVTMHGNILSLRLKNKAIDVTTTGAYAPGDHRTSGSKILGLDADGHVGRDGVGDIRAAGQERWTNNGRK